MANRTLVLFEEQSGITSQSDNIIINPGQEVTAAACLTSGSPATGAILQVTLDTPQKITAGSAQWVNSPLGNRIVSGAEKIMRPVTGVRLKVTDGTWTLQVRQA